MVEQLEQLAELGPARPFVLIEGKRDRGDYRRVRDADVIERSRGEGKTGAAPEVHGIVRVDPGVEVPRAEVRAARRGTG